MNSIGCYLFISLTSLTAIISSYNHSSAYEKSSNVAYYEVVQEDDSFLHTYSVNELFSVNVVYDGFVNPPLTYEYSASRNGLLYKGTLKLSGTKYKDGKTIATYSGTIYPSN